MKDWKHFLKDAGAIACSLVVAVLLGRSEVASAFLTSTSDVRHLGSLAAGLFFTSVFTTAPAIVALATIAASGSILSTAALGAAGAVVGDLTLFLIVRDRLSDHVQAHLKNSRGWGRFLLLLRSKSFRWFSFFLGGLLIASPLPDELGISLLGLSRMRTTWFIALSYAFNFMGILLIGGVADLLR